jgi:hypothetical protein
MPSDEPPISLNLNAPAPPVSSAAPVPVEQLQFRQAEPVDAQVASRRCAACKSPIYSTYFQAVGKDFCPACSERLRSVLQAPPAHSLLKAALYGGVAALAGCALYAAVAIVANLELAILAILIGWMVGKAIRYGSEGRGGRPQQILAVLLTYFAITFSYIVVFIYNSAQKPPAAAQQSAAPQSMERPRAPLSVGALVVGIVTLAAIAPFFELGSNPMSGVLSLVIIFFGLRRAWAMTGRADIMILGPYNAAEGT